MTVTGTYEFTGSSETLDVSTFDVLRVILRGAGGEDGEEGDGFDEEDPSDNTAGGEGARGGRLEVEVDVSGFETVDIYPPGRPWGFEDGGLGGEGQDTGTQAGGDGGNGAGAGAIVDENGNALAVVDGGGAGGGGGATAGSNFRSGGGGGGGARGGEGGPSGGQDGGDGQGVGSGGNGGEAGDTGNQDGENGTIGGVEVIDPALVTVLDEQDGGGNDGNGEIEVTLAAGDAEPVISTLETLDATTVNLEWTYNQAAVENETVEVRAFYPTTSETVTLAELAAGTTTHTATNVRNGRQFEIVVAIVTDDIESVSDAVADVPTPLPDVDGFMLDGSAPEELAVEEITPALNHGDYRVRWKRSNEPAFDAADELTVPYDAAPLEAVLTDILDGEEYDVHVRSETVDATGEYLEADELTALFAADELAFSAVGESSVTITWTDNSEFDGSYQIYRARADYDYDDSRGRVVATVADTAQEYVDDGVAPEREYGYIVSAVTQYVHADSASATVTTETAGLEQSRVPPRGWYAEVDHPDGNVLRPDILDTPSITPAVNDLPRASLPVPQTESWQDEAFDDAPMRLWLDGERKPIDTLEHRRVRPDSDDLEGRGGTELLRRESLEIEEQAFDDVLRELIEQSTSYVANVDDPESESQPDTPLQAPSTPEDLSTVTTFANTSPFYISEDGIEAHDVGWVFEGTEASGDAQVLDIYSDGEALALQDQTTYTVGSVTPEYDIEDWRVFYRLRVAGGNNEANNAFDIRVGGELAESIPANALSGELQWREGLEGSTTLEAGESYPLEIEVTDFGDEVPYLDVIATVDDRYAKDVGDLDNEVHVAFGYLNDPATKPEFERLEIDEAVSPIGIEAATVTLDAPRGDETIREVGISSDSETYDTVEDANTHSVTFEELSTTAKLRFGIGTTDATRNDQTPRENFESQLVTSFEFVADLDDTPIITNREFDGRISDIITEICEYANAVWEFRRSDGIESVEVTQLGGRPSDADEDLADYEFDRQTEDTIERAIIKGSSQRVVREAFTADVGEWVSLSRGQLVAGKESVYDPETDESFVRGDDYRLQRGRESTDDVAAIQVLASGEMDDGVEYRIDYDFKPVGEFTALDFEGEPEEAKTIVEDLPGLSTAIACEQTALYLVQRFGTAINEGTVTVPDESTQWSVIDAIAPSALPGGDVYQIRGVDSRPGESVFQVAEQEGIAEGLAQIRDSLRRTTEKV